MNEDVKKILWEVGSVAITAETQLASKAQIEKALAGYAQQICQLLKREIREWIEKTFAKGITLNQMMAANTWQKFFESPDNPDGYEPKAILDKGMGKIILKPKPDELKRVNKIRLSSLEDFEGKLCVLEEREDGSTYLLGYFEQEPQLIGFRKADEPKPDEGRLVDFTLVMSGQGTDYQKFKRAVEAQRDLTASIKDAECQERVEGIFREIEAHEIPTVIDLHLIQIMMCKEDWQALKEGVK